MMRWLLVVFLTVFIHSNSWSQENLGSEFFRNISTKQDSGSLVVIQEQGIEQLLGIHMNANKRNKGIDGYRIQLYLGSNKNAKKEATKIKGKLLSLFPDERPYIMYEAPFWRVQVGDFRSKNESLELYTKLKNQFPNCYPVPVNNIPIKNLK